MSYPELVVKRSQSECFSFKPQIFSPSPVKKVPKIGSNIAREISDFSSANEEIRIKPRANTTPNLMSAHKSTPPKFDSDFSNEFSSDSNCSSFMRECESPDVSVKNPFYQEHIFEEVSCELPSRTSNPITKDLNFKLNEKKLFGFAINTVLPCVPDTLKL